MSDEDSLESFEERVRRKFERMKQEAHERSRKKWEERIPKNAKLLICPLCGDHRLEHLPEVWKKHVRKFRAEKRKLAKKRQNMTPDELKKLIKEQYNLCPEFFQNELNLLKIDDFRETDIFEFDQYSFFALINRGLFSDKHLNQLILKEYLIRKRAKVFEAPEDVQRVRLENNLMCEFIIQKQNFLEYLEFAENRMKELKINPDDAESVKRGLKVLDTKSRELLGLTLIEDDKSKRKKKEEE